MFIMNRCVLISMIVAVALLHVNGACGIGWEVSRSVNPGRWCIRLGRAELAESPEKGTPA